MERITWINIGNKVYPMCFSLGAEKKINEKYGSLVEYFNACRNSKTVKEAYTDGLEILIQFGAKRLNVLSDGTIKENAAISEEGEWLPISKENLEILLVAGNLEMVGAKINAAANLAAEKEIKAKPTKETRKNSKTAPEATN